MNKWLQDLRDNSGLTQKALAEKLGISEQYVYLIESGARRPSVETAKKIAAEFGFEWTRFFEDGDAPADNKAPSEEGA